MLKYILAAILTLFIYAGCAGAAPIHITINPSADRDSDKYLVAEYLGRLLNERSHGRILIELKTTDVNSAVDQLKSGDAQIIIPEISQLSLTDSQLAIYEFPLLFHDRIQFQNVVDQQAGFLLSTAKFEKPTRVLSIWEEGAQYLVFSAAVDRAAQPFHFSNLSGKVLDQLLNELLPCSKNVSSSNWTIATLAKILETADSKEGKVISQEGILMSASVLLADSIFWDRLPNDIKVIVNDAIKDATTYARELALQSELALKIQLQGRKDIRIKRIDLDSIQLWRKKLVALAATECSSNQNKLLKDLTAYISE